MEELESLLTLTQIPLLGPNKIRLLIRHYGSAQAALQVSASDLSLLPSFGKKIVEAWERGVDERQFEQNLSLVRKLGVQIIPFTSPLYPKKLLEIPDAPILLYVQGNAALLNEKSMAVVGTRQCTLYGQEMARQLSADLAQSGYVIVSGLARGIDTFAHQGALQTGTTIAVLGSGLASIYPAENKQLAALISAQGALVSEFPMHTPPDRQRFPQRNRIVSGMTLGTLLVEAPVLSGAMLTARKAISENKKVFTLPGRADQESFRGNHSLIKEGCAYLIENARDLLAHYPTDSLPLSLQTPLRPIVLLEKEEEEVLQIFPLQEITLEELIQRVKVPVHRLNILLMSLVLKKMVKEYPGKIYKKV